MYGSGIPINAKKVSNREMRRRAQAAINAGTEAILVLLACLAQKGGEIVVTQGTLDQCARNLENLDFEIKGGVNPNEFIVRLLEGKADGHEEAGHAGDRNGGEAEHGAGDEPVPVDGAPVETPEAP